MELLRLDSDSDIVEIYLPIAEVKRAKCDYTPLITDLVHTQQLFNDYHSKTEICEMVEGISEAGDMSMDNFSSLRRSQRE
ncbi:hypothetical protein FQA39_LY05149 [Lamprigera yunnana]|nr:hypothetical protein FQA39_LY05149 [Lamprigera yunnana]